jgi:hypothetical protein
MTIVFIILFILIALIGLILIVALFTGKDYSIQRDIIIERPVHDVFAYIKHLKNQDNYNKWVMADPNMKKDFRGTDGTTGFVYAWNGNAKAGEGEMEIKGLAENKNLDVEIRFVRPFAGIARAPLAVEPAGNDTRVIWGMHSAMKYPMNIMLLFLNMDTMLGKDLEESLGNLKRILEK